MEVKSLRAAYFGIACSLLILATTVFVSLGSEHVLQSESYSYIFVEANNQFALDLYSKLSNNEDNIFFSPYSISSALAMVYEGAKNETAEEIKNVFHFPENRVILRKSFEELYSRISDNEECELYASNALWIQNNFRILEDYANVIRQYYHGETKNLDFASDPEGSREIINEWVDEKTHHKIKELIPRNSIDKLTRLVITNAIYFSGKWESSFSDIKSDDFWITPNKSIKVPMMRQTNYFNYAEIENVQVLELPYVGDKLSMIILLPKGCNGSDIKDIEKPLREYKNKLQSRYVRVIIPKFKFVKSYDVKGILQKMGIFKAFMPAANFSGITKLRGLYISGIFHKAFIDVNENGTKASAATGVVIPTIGINPKSEPTPILFKADHPFVFIIQDRESGAILFMGRVLNPEI